MQDYHKAETATSNPDTVGCVPDHTASAGADMALSSDESVSGPDCAASGLINAILPDWIPERCACGWLPDGLLRICGGGTVTEVAAAHRTADPYPGCAILWVRQGSGQCAEPGRTSGRIQITENMRQADAGRDEEAPPPAAVRDPEMRHPGRPLHSLALQAGDIYLADMSGGLDLSCGGRGWSFQILVLPACVPLTAYRQLWHGRSGDGIIRALERAYAADLLDGLMQFPAEPAPGQQLMISHYLNQFFVFMLEADAGEPGGKRTPSWLGEVKRRMEQNYSMNFSLAALERETGVSRYRICREFRSAYGRPPMQYLQQLRLDRAKLLLRTTTRPVGEIAFEVGIPDTTHFINLFKRETGQTPLKYRQGSG